MNRPFFRIFTQIALAILVLLAMPTVIYTVSNVVEAREQAQTAYQEKQVEQAETLIRIIEDKIHDLQDVYFFIQKEEWLAQYIRPIIDPDDFDLVSRQRYTARLRILLANAQIAKDIAVVVPDKDTIISSNGWFTANQYALTYYPIHLEDFAPSAPGSGLPMELYTPCNHTLCTSSLCRYLIPVHFNFYGDNAAYRVLFLIDQRLFASYIDQISSGTDMDIYIQMDDYIFYGYPGGIPDYQSVSSITNLSYSFHFKPMDPLYINSMMSSNLLTIMIVLSFFSLVSLALAYVLTKPILRLYNKITGGAASWRKPQGQPLQAPAPSRPGNVFHMLETSINTMTEERIELGQKLDRYKRLVSNDDLLFNILIADDTEQFEDEIRDFWPWFSAEGYCSVILFNSRNGQSTDTYLEEILDRIEETLPQDSVEYRLLNILNSDAALLLYFGDDAQQYNSRMYQDMYEALGHALQEALKENYYIGFGSIERGILGIQTSYHQARKGYLNLIYAAGEHETTIQYFYPITMELQLINCLKLSKQDKCREILEVLFNQNKALHLSQSQTLKLYTIISDTLLRYAMENDIDYHSHQQRLHSQFHNRSFSTIPETIQDLCIYLCQATQQRRDRADRSAKKHVSDYVYSNYYDPDMSLQLLSSRYNIPVSTLSKQFKEAVGCNFYDFLCRTRVEKAIELIRDGKYTITKIGRLVGYENYASFKRAFVKFTGVSPSEFKTLE